MNRELLMLVEAISREKNVERDLVFEAGRDEDARVAGELAGRKSTRLNSSH